MAREADRAPGYEIWWKTGLQSDVQPGRTD
jgi:hypothetical protein